jgi:hypothetical protein
VQEIPEFNIRQKGLLAAQHGIYGDTTYSPELAPFAEGDQLNLPQ